MKYDQFGKYIKTLRLNYGLSRKKVSQATGISVETIRRVEIGVPEVRNSTLEILSNYYKENLIKALGKEFDEDSLFSRDLIEDLGFCLKLSSYDAISERLREIKLYFENLYTRNKKQNFILAELLEAIGKLNQTGVRDAKSTIILLENLLLGLSIHTGQILGDHKIYEIEYLVASTLVTFYRRSGQNDKATELCEKALAKLKLENRNEYVINRFLGTFYFNLSYSYHINDWHEKVIAISNEILNTEDLLLNRMTLSGIYFRLSMAEHSLNLESWRETLTTALMLAPDSTRIYLMQYLKEHEIER